MIQALLWSMLGLLLMLAASGSAGPTGSPADDPLSVATRHVPLFAIMQEDGTWHGISIDLLREIADTTRNGN